MEASCFSKEDVLFLLSPEGHDLKELGELSYSVRRSASWNIEKSAWCKITIIIIITHLAGHEAYTGFCLVHVQETIWGIKPVPLLLPAAFLLAMYRFL
jgi:hypothetical protein